MTEFSNLLSASAVNSPHGSNQNPDRVWWNSTITGLQDQTGPAVGAAPGYVQLGGDVNDTQYVGFVSAQFSRVYYNVTTEGDVNGVVLWEYWNGAVWKPFPRILDGTKSFTVPGVRSVNFTLPSDWVQTTVPFSPQGLLQPFTAFYARARTMSPYGTAVPKAGRVWIFARPLLPNVQFELGLWDGIGVSSANVSLWVPALPIVQVANLTKGTIGGIFEFNSTELGFEGGESFFIRVSKIGYQNITTPTFTYDISKPIMDLGMFTLHGSLRVNVLKAFSSSAGVPSPSGSVTDHSGLAAPIGTGLNDGIIEFGVDWRVHPKVNVTIFKRGWLTNSTLRNISLTPWNTTTGSISLGTTVRVNIVSELHTTIPRAAVTVIDSAGTEVRTSVDGSVDDQDGVADGIVYIPLDPASVLNPISIVVSRTGFSTFVGGSWSVNSATQLNITTLPGLQYGLKVEASDELNNHLILAKANTTFTGLLISQVDFSQGSAFVAADPSSPGVLTITAKGYVNTPTSTTIKPPTPNVFKAQTITYQSNGGNGPGLPFTIRVVGVYDELGNRLEIGSKVTFASTAGSSTTSSGNAYIPAYGEVNITAISPGYISQTLKVDPTSSSQTTIILGNATSSVTIIRPGLRFSLKIVGVFDELGNRFLLGTNATITSSTSEVFLVSGRAYIPASSPTDVTAAANGYVSATFTVTPSTLLQTMILFKNGATSADIIEPGLLFTLKVLVSQSWDGSAVQGATVDAFPDPAMTKALTSSQSDASGTSYLPLSPGTVYLKVLNANYLTFLSPALQISYSSQTISAVSFASGTTLINGGKANVTLIANSNIFNPEYSAAFGVTFTYSSPVAGTVNATIPRLLVPSGSTVEVFIARQMANFRLAQDAYNVYIQVSTLPGTANVQIAFNQAQSPNSPWSPLQSPASLGALAVGAVAAVSIPLMVVRRRKSRRIDFRHRSWVRS